MAASGNGNSMRGRRHFSVLLLFGGLVLTSFFLLSPASPHMRTLLKQDRTRIFPLIHFFRRIYYRWILPELFRDLPNPPLYSQAVVIGSGFGGAITAWHLAQKGISTIVLERGQDWPISKRRPIHTYEPLRDGRGLWHRNRGRNPIIARNGLNMRVDHFGGILDLTEYETIEIFRGACVGGGSKVFTGVMVPPVRKDYFDAIFNHTNVTYEEMNTIYYPRVQNKLDLSPVPDDIYNSRPYGKSRTWDEAAAGAGYEIQRPNSIFDWDIIRAELTGKSRRSATIGMSNMGNSNGAKFDVTQNYLKQAKESGFVTVYPNQQVIDINDLASGNYQVDVDKLDPYGKIVDRYSIECECLFLAAGSIGTSELLVKAKAKGTISGLNDEVGKGWGSNGDLAAVYISGPVPQIRAQAAPCTSLIHDTDGLFPVTFEAWYVPIAPDIGVQGSLGMVSGLPHRGQFVYQTKTDTVDLKWPQEANKVVEEVGWRVNKKLADNNTPRGVTGFWPLSPDVWAGFTAHPLGGAVIGKATDDYGRLKDGLYVMDGALIPASTGAANPALTISALAERNMEHIITQDF